MECGAAVYASQTKQVKEDGQNHHQKTGQEEIVVIHEGEAVMPARVRALQTLLLDVPDQPKDKKKKKSSKLCHVHNFTFNIISMHHFMKSTHTHTHKNYFLF